MSVRIYNCVCMKCNSTYVRELFSNEPVHMCPRCLRRHTLHDLVERKGLGPAYGGRAGSMDLLAIALLIVIVYGAAYYLIS